MRSCKRIIGGRGVRRWRICQRVTRYPGGAEEERERGWGRERLRRGKREEGRACIFLEKLQIEEKIMIFDFDLGVNANYY